jgi:stress-induced morphogen
MRIQQALEERLRDALAPTYLKLTNESHRHRVAPGSETHFSAVLVSPAFAGKALVARHRAVHDAIGDDLRQTVHAFSMRTLTPEEWDEQSRPSEHAAPPCRGGSK